MVDWIPDFITQAMTFWGTAKNRYQMEVPESMLKKVPDDYELFSSKKGWKRYRTSEIDDMLAELGDSEDRKDAALKDTMRRIFHSYDDRWEMVSLSRKNVESEKACILIYLWCVHIDLKRRCIYQNISLMTSTLLSDLLMTPVLWPCELTFGILWHFDDLNTLTLKIDLLVTSDSLMTSTLGPDLLVTSDLFMTPTLRPWELTFC